MESSIHGKLKHKSQTILESLFGTLDHHQIFMIKHSWNHIVFLEQSLSDLEKRIDQLLIPYQEEVEILTTMPVAASILAEIGTDMNQFPSSKHLSSWAGVSPGNHKSAGKKKVRGR